MPRNKSENDNSEKLRAWVLACPVIDTDKGYHLSVNITTHTNCHILEYSNHGIIQETHIDHGTK